MPTQPAEKKTLSVPVPPALDAFIKDRVKTKGFHTVSEYIRSLIRADLEAASRHEVEAQLLEAIERGDYREATPAFWQRMEAAATGKAVRKRKPKKS